MKIWYQTGTTYRYDPLFEAYGRNLEELCKRATRPDTEVYVTGVPKVMPEIDKYKSIMYYHQSQILKNMLRAEKEGYDAFVIGCSFDPVMDEGREMLSIPVVSIAHANVYMAAMLGELFAVVTCEPHIAEKYRQMIIRYGLHEKHLQGSYVSPISEWELAEALSKDPKPVAEKFKAVCEKAVADGASVLIPVPAFIYQLFYKSGGLTNVNGATFLDPVAVAIKLAETLADLSKIGIEVSRTLQVYGSPGKELLKDVFKTYAPVFKIDY